MKACPTELELARALTVGAEPALEAHLANCATCRTEWNATRRAIALAREVCAELPAASRREEVRTAVLASGTRGVHRASSRTKLALGIAVAAAAAAAVFVALPTSSEPPALVAHGTVRAESTARFTATMPPDEIVRLVDGQLEIEVTPLGAGERFRVIVGDAEIEVRGTAFEVIARGDRLVSVSVQRGRVDVRPSAGTPTTLESGQSWRVTVATTPPPAPIVPVPEPIVQRAPTVRQPKRVAVPPPAPVVIKPEPAARPPIELAYEDAWDAMRHGSFSRAALQFARVLALEPDGSLAEDAAFWRPVALARAKQRALAITAFRDLLDRRGHAKSPHAGEANAMLGWLLIDDRKFDEATLRFRAAIDDASPAVRKSARAGLDAIARH